MAVIVGHKFGQLTVIAEQTNAAKPSWICRCICGKECVCTEIQLRQGKRTHCGCQTTRNGQTEDLRGKRIHHLTALEPMDRRDAKRSVIWRCRCDCGREVEISRNMLLYSNTRSCGCLKREHELALSDYLNRVDGTSIDQLKSEKLPKNNTTGVKGVYLHRGRYIAKIVFQGHQYHLGAYSSLEEAAAIRQQAEDELRTNLVSAWEEWRSRAAQNPEWADAHPMSIRVERVQPNQLALHITYGEKA